MVIELQARRQGSKQGRKSNLIVPDPDSPFSNLILIPISILILILILRFRTFSFSLHCCSLLFPGSLNQSSGFIKGTFCEPSFADWRTFANDQQPETHHQQQETAHHHQQPETKQHSISISQTQCISISSLRSSISMSRSSISPPPKPLHSAPRVKLVSSKVFFTN